MEKLSIDLDFDKNMNAIIILGCPQCKKKQKIPAKNMTNGKKFPCGCGFVAEISGDDFRSLQRSIDDLKRTLNNFGK